MKSMFERKIIEAIPHLLRYANIFLYDKHQAEDFVQEVVFRALEKKRSFDPNKGSVKAWLRGFAVRVLREYQRSNRTIPYEKIEVEKILVTWQQDEDHDPILFVRECMDELQSKDQHMLHMRYREDYSIKDIATLLQKTSQAVKTKLHRLRTVLSRCITQKQTRQDRT
ncbi:RNA polymerase sigma factor [Candidatus Uabimicrobium sp. HlEnr_7]|uniref:RNA polymerase sigma factor n=1 Tax=Candidatus Uabimicrobium helgolandensis TaxID=3095367 RepID=UPI003555EF3B